MRSSPPQSLVTLGLPPTPELVATEVAQVDVDGPNPALLVSAAVTRVRRADAADAEPLAAVLGRAFANNPFVRWIVPDDGHYASIATEFFRLGVDRELADGEVYTTADHAGAALWLPPESTPPGTVEQFRVGRRLLSILGRRTLVGARALDTFERRRPEREHWYLTVLGTEPDRQGQGVGGTLLQPILERCDRTGVAAYLESSDPANVDYYRRFGFRTTGAIEFRGGPTVPLMLREPRAESSGSGPLLFSPKIY